MAMKRAYLREKREKKEKKVETAVAVEAGLRPSAVVRGNRRKKLIFFLKETWEITIYVSTTWCIRPVGD